LWHPKIRSQTFNGGSAMKVIHLLGGGIWH
jgi:hypothetical protein